MSTSTHPKTVLNVSLGRSDRDYDAHVTFLHHDFRIVRLGTGGDVNVASELIRKWVEYADAIAVTGVREARVAGLYDGELDAIDRLKEEAESVPVTDGLRLGDVLQEWAIRHVQTEMPGFFDNARTVVLGGPNHERTTRILREFTENLEFADPLLRLDLPARLDSLPLLGLAAGIGMWPVHRLPRAE